ncbi:MAG: deoxyhypusine synthase [Candidatus Thorarchaeota archaeon]|nr:deoxyhypusine synthase [Candidatus Thorarchaeota archaeon]
MEHIDPAKVNDLSDLLRAMSDVGVLGAGRLGRAATIVSRMFDDPTCMTYLSMSGPLVPGGIRKIVSQLVEKELIDVIVTSGANIVHDLLEAYGGRHYQLPPGTSDQTLRHQGMGRIADIFTREEDFEVFEKKIYDFLDGLAVQDRTQLGPSEFLQRLGATLDDHESFIYQAAHHGVPIFSPGLMDSMLGFHLFTYSTVTNVTLDFVKDLRILSGIVNEAKKTGAIMLGGGLTKHFTMGSTILRGGLDYAVQITLDRPEGGSLSGAPLVEGVSWQKMQEEAKFATVIGDVTIIFPLLVLGALQMRASPT